MSDIPSWIKLDWGSILAAAKILCATDLKAIEKAVRIIRKGGLVAFPTETVYGLGADASNPIAVAKIFEVKNRPSIDPIIVHVSDAESAKFYGNFPELAVRLTSMFWPGPLTLVVYKHAIIPPIVTAGLDTIAIRVPSHPVALALIKECGCAIAAPSANLFGYVSPTEAQHVAEQLGDRIDLILDGGRCAVGVESTVISLVDQTPCLLRSGGITVEELEMIIGKINRTVSTASRPRSPGQMNRHYATQTPLEIISEHDDTLYPDEKVGLLSLTAPSNPNNYYMVEVLSASGNLREAAANLFAALHRLDSFGLDRIVARPIPARGLGAAIMDRLRRCSAKE